MEIPKVYFDTNMLMDTIMKKSMGIIPWWNSWMQNIP